MVNWQQLRSITQLDQLIERSRVKPVLVFAHSASSTESKLVGQKLYSEWDIQQDMLDCYLLNVDTNGDILREMASFSQIDPTIPQIYLLADAVTMYDEAGNSINVRKIKIALKIINRTYKWMETRV